MFRNLPRAGYSESLPGEPITNDNESQDKRKQIRKSVKRTKSKVKTKTDTAEMKFIQTNYNGFTTKKESFEEIIDDENPDMLNINHRGTTENDTFFAGMKI